MPLDCLLLVTYKNDLDQIAVGMISKFADDIKKVVWWTVKRLPKVLVSRSTGKVDKRIGG